MLHEWRNFLITSASIWTLAFFSFTFPDHSSVCSLLFRPSGNTEDFSPVKHNFQATPATRLLCQRYGAKTSWRISSRGVDGCQALCHHHLHHHRQRHLGPLPRFSPSTRAVSQVIWKLNGTIKSFFVSVGFFLMMKFSGGFSSFLSGSAPTTTYPASPPLS